MGIEAGIVNGNKHGNGNKTKDRNKNKMKSGN